MPKGSAAKKQGILLDIGCADLERGPNWTGMDIRPLPNVDVVHDIEKFPWPFKDESVLTSVASHTLEHIKPWHQIAVFNEIWRITKANGQLAITVPYGVGFGYVQDPTHCTPFNEATFLYYDPYPAVFGWNHRKPNVIGKTNPYWKVYRPNPWRIALWYWQSNGDMEVLLAKRPLSCIREEDKLGK